MGSEEGILSNYIKFMHEKWKSILGFVDHDDWRRLAEKGEVAKRDLGGRIKDWLVFAYIEAVISVAITSLLFLFLLFLPSSFFLPLSEGGKFEEIGSISIILFAAVSLGISLGIIGGISLWLLMPILGLISRGLFSIPIYIVAKILGGKGSLRDQFSALLIAEITTKTLIGIPLYLVNIAAIPIISITGSRVLSLLSLILSLIGLIYNLYITSKALAFVNRVGTLRGFIIWLLALILTVIIIIITIITIVAILVLLFHLSIPPTLFR